MREFTTFLLRNSGNDWEYIMFRSLLANPEFKAGFLRRFADHLNTSFLPQVVLEKIRPHAGDH